METVKTAWGVRKGLGVVGLWSGLDRTKMRDINVLGTPWAVAQTL